MCVQVTPGVPTLPYPNGTGKGGQNKNKVETDCRITHPASGAIGYSGTHRTQLQNKKTAFERLVASDKFKKWHKIEVARHFGHQVKEQVDYSMSPKNLKVEYLGNEN